MEPLLDDVVWTGVQNLPCDAPLPDTDDELNEHIKVCRICDIELRT
jgi:hypothetical protein